MIKLIFINVDTHHWSITKRLRFDIKKIRSKQNGYNAKALKV